MGWPSVQTKHAQNRGFEQILAYNNTAPAYFHTHGDYLYPNPCCLLHGVPMVCL
jgi:hypothetical protein